jgi:hypothetical protein
VYLTPALGCIGGQELLKEQLSLLYMQKGDGSVLQGGGSVLQSVGTT